MRFLVSCCCVLLAGSFLPVAPAQGIADRSSSASAVGARNPRVSQRVPSGAILVKGAWSGASDSVTPVPEGASVSGNVFTDEYFGMTFTLPGGWTQKYQGPPPSESGRYVLAQLRPADRDRGAKRGNILVTAQDLFFTPLPIANARELTAYEKDNLRSSYRLERPLIETQIAGRSFTFYGYWSPAAGMHWYVLATEIRCHAVEFVLTSRDTQLLAGMMRDMESMKLPAGADPGGGPFPICIKDYANGGNLIARVDPVLTEHRFTAVPVRVIIDEHGRVKHIHFLSAFPDQERLIADALLQWRFKPYLKNGRPLEVETGIMFGRAPPPLAPARASRASSP